MHYLITTTEGLIEIDFYPSDEAARHALMRDLYEHYQEWDLPAEDSEEAINRFLGDNNITGVDFSYLIGEVPTMTPPERDVIIAALRLFQMQDELPNEIVALAENGRGHGGFLTDEEIDTLIEEVLQ